MSIWQAGREFGLSRKDDPQDAGLFGAARLRAEEAGPKAEVGVVAGVIDQILVDDKSQPKKQR